jgi:hypothetical protein
MKRARALLVLAILIVAILIALAGCSQGSTGGAKAGGRGEFPASVYPRPASFPHWGSPAGCASLSGVRSVPQNAAQASLRVLSQWGHVRRARDFRLSDRAEWPIVKENWAHRRGHAPLVQLLPGDVVQGPGARSPYAGLVRANCGAQILGKSWWVAVCPGPLGRRGHCTLSTAPALTEQYLLVDRRGHWLVWFTNP